MPISDFLTQSCLLLQRDPTGSEDGYGNLLEQETSAETVCSLQQLARQEPGGQGELSDTLWLLVLPAGTEVTTGDAVLVDAHRYELVGEPWQVIDPTGQAEHHVECTVRRTAGSEDAS